MKVPHGGERAEYLDPKKVEGKKYASHRKDSKPPRSGYSGDKLRRKAFERSL